MKASQVPDDGQYYVVRRMPGKTQVEFVPLPPPDLSSTLPRDGSRLLTASLRVKAPTLRDHAVTRAYVDQQVAYIKGEITRLEGLLAPKPPRDLRGEARGRTYTANPTL